MRITAYSMFKNNVKPEWEDENNINGSEWGCREEIEGSVVSEIWKNLCASLAGNTINALGARVVNKTTSFRKMTKIEVWIGENDDPIRCLVRHFKVSSLVILRRLRDVDELDANTFRKLYKDEEARFASIQARQKAKGGGGNYYASKNVQVGRRFARALIGSALEGRTPYREAYSLLGVRKAETFNNFARQLNFRV